MAAFVLHLWEAFDVHNGFLYVSFVFVKHLQLSRHVFDDDNTIIVGIKGSTDPSSSGGVQRLMNDESFFDYVAEKILHQFCYNFLIIIILII